MGISLQRIVKILNLYLIPHLININNVYFRLENLAYSVLTLTKSKSILKP